MALDLVKHKKLTLNSLQKAVNSVDMFLNLAEREFDKSNDPEDFFEFDNQQNLRQAASHVASAVESVRIVRTKRQVK